MRALIGVDLNGAHDWLARFEDADGQDSKEEILDLGVRGAMIRLRQPDRRQWVADKQAETAPHGRGLGWGDIGKSENRLSFLEVLDGLRSGDTDERVREALAVSLRSLVGDADRAVFAVPDIPAYGEAFQDRLIDMLASATGRRPLLLWRPVAALLGYIRQHPDNLQPGAEVAVLSLMADGLHLSSLSLDRERDDGRLVPSRGKSGESADTAFRGIQLVEEAQRWLAGKTSMKLEEIEAAALSPWRYATAGERETRELVRLASNRGWLKLPQLTGRLTASCHSGFPAPFRKLLGKARALLIEGPFAGNPEWRGEIETALGESTGLPGAVDVLDSGTVALGCLEAAERERDGRSIYFDVLPQLKINAVENDIPQFVNLIEPGARCRGGNTFRGYAPGNFVIQKGATRPEFWLFKEALDGVPQGRQADVTFSVPVDRQCSLTVSVEQTPGQGSAVVRIASPHLEEMGQPPIVLNWNDMKPVEESKDEILKTLRNRSPGGSHYPNTYVKQGHVALWAARRRTASLVRELEIYCDLPLVQRRGDVNGDAWAQLKRLRSRFSKPAPVGFLFRKLKEKSNAFGRFHALNADGTLPPPADGFDFPVEAGDVFDRALSKCAQDFIALKERFGDDTAPELLGDMVGFASWCFWKCPEEITGFLLKTYEDAQFRGISHVLIRQGVARVIHKTEHIQRYFFAFENALLEEERIVSDDYAGLARVLGTVEHAASILMPDLADHICDMTVEAIDKENRKGNVHAYKRGFKYAMLMLAGLLRHRERQPTFLNPGKRITNRLLARLGSAEERSEKLIELIPEDTNRLEEVKKIIAEIKKHMQLEGGDPNIIVYIDSIPED